MQEQISLLWPVGHQPPARSAAGLSSWRDDLGLDYLVQALDYDGRQASQVCAILVALCSKPEVIRYRQEVLADVSSNQGLQDALAALLPVLRELGEIQRHAIRIEGNQLLQVVRRFK